MSFPLLAALVAAVLQPTPPAPAVDSPIVVTGERIADLRARLAACIARHCPPDEDVDASLALAEGQFLNGDYDHAAEAIRASLGRNRRFAAAYPEPVADLFRSYARVHWHRGRDQEALSATRNILDTLRGGIPQEDHRHFTARLEYIAALSKAGQDATARTELSALARVARAAGRDDVARFAELRGVLMTAATDPGRGPAVRRLEALAADRSEGARYESVTARLFLARLYRRRGDIARSDAMLAAIPAGDGGRRRLLYDPPYDIRGASAPQQGETGSTSRLLTGPLEDKWVDVAYWIEPDGHVGDVQVVREGSPSDWAAPLLRSIRGRVFTASPQATPSYRLERYTFTAPLQVVTGSRMARRSPAVRLEPMDLTVNAESGRAPDAAVQARPPARGD